MVPALCLLGRGVGRNTVWVREERNSAGGLTVTPTTGTRESVAMRSVLLKIWWLTWAVQTMMLDRRRVDVVCWVTMDHYHKLSYRNKGYAETGVELILSLSSL